MCLIAVHAGELHEGDEVMHKGFAMVVMSLRTGTAPKSNNYPDRGPWVNVTMRPRAAEGPSCVVEMPAEMFVVLLEDCLA